MIKYISRRSVLSLYEKRRESIRRNYEDYEQVSAKIGNILEMLIVAISRPLNDGR